MKFEFIKITLPLELGEYAEGLRGQAIQVWINPSRAKKLERLEILRSYGEFLAELAGKRKKKILKVESKKRELELLRQMFAWLADLWSQHPDLESHCDAESIDELYQVDPALYEWLTRRSIEMIEGFRADQKKV